MMLPVNGYDFVFYIAVSNLAQLVAGTSKRPRSAVKVPDPSFLPVCCGVPSYVLVYCPVGLRAV